MTHGARNWQDGRVQGGGTRSQVSTADVHDAVRVAPYPPALSPPWYLAFAPPIGSAPLMSKGGTYVVW